MVRGALPLRVLSIREVEQLQLQALSQILQGMMEMLSREGEEMAMQATLVQIHLPRVDFEFFFFL